MTRCKNFLGVVDTFLKSTDTLTHIDLDAWDCWRAWCELTSPLSDSYDWQTTLKSVGRCDPVWGWAISVLRSTGEGTCCGLRGGWQVKPRLQHICSTGSSICLVCFHITSHWEIKMSICILHTQYFLFLKKKQFRQLSFWWNEKVKAHFATKICHGKV